LAISSCPPARSSHLPQPVNDPFIEAIVERIRALVSRQSAGAVNAFATSLGVSPADFRVFIDDRERLIDVLFLIDVVAAFVREFAVDPQWLLIGRYDGATHRHALMLGEDRTAVGVSALREFVRQQYERVRTGVKFLSMPPPSATG
jgi:hypothetical protein